MLLGRRRRILRTMATRVLPVTLVRKMLKACKGNLNFAIRLI